MHGEDIEGKMCDAGHNLAIPCTEVIKGKDVVSQRDNHLVAVGNQHHIRHPWQPTSLQLQ